MDGNSWVERGQKLVETPVLAGVRGRAARRFELEGGDVLVTHQPLP
jgi:hypothetical protein